MTKEVEGASILLVNKQLIFQNKEKEKRAAELIIANKELAFQNQEKGKRAAELIIANRELVFQNKEKEKRAAELIIANKELAFQNEEKEKRAAELIIANKELIFQNEEKEKRAAELIIANKELAFQNEEKEKRAAELIIANKELIFQNEEKEKRAAELIIANRLYAFLSQINQTIIHSKNEQTVYNEACRIAIEVGKFELAAISIPDKKNKKLNITAHFNAFESDIEFLNSIIYEDKGPTKSVLQNGKPYIINNYEDETRIGGSKTYASDRGFKSCILLPIKKDGKTIGVYNLFSTSINLFDSEEISLLEEAAGNISFALDVFEKEHQRKQMEDIVTHSEQRLKQAQSIAHFGSWEFNISTATVACSAEACRIYGYPQDECIQSYHAWVSFIHPDDLKHVMRIIGAGERTLSGISFHHRIIRKDGTIRHIYCQAKFEFDKKGKPLMLHGTAHDITEMNEAEEALAQSEANLRQIMDLIPQSIFVKDYNGKFIFVNKSFTMLYGLNPRQVVNKTMDEIISEKKEVENLLKDDREVISSGKPETIPQHVFTDNKGGVHLLHILKVPFTVAGTNEKAVLGISMDITEQVNAEKERTKIIEDIVQRNNDLEKFSYIISHNLRAPVANILGLVSIIETIGVDKDEAKTITAYLTTAAKNLDNVVIDINDILEIKHNLTENRKNVKFEDMLSQIKLRIDDTTNDQAPTIISDFSEVEEMITIKSYLYSIFYNLVTNSLKYRRPGIPPVIEITSHKINNKIQLVFKDNGLGIDLKKNAEGLFGLYKRFHYHVEGKGMGLFMVKTQVDALGGKIFLTSEVNKGSEFRIEFEERIEAG